MCLFSSLTGCLFLVQEVLGSNPCPSSQTSFFPSQDETQLIMALEFSLKNVKCCFAHWQGFYFWIQKSWVQIPPRPQTPQNRKVNKLVVLASQDETHFIIVF